MNKRINALIYAYLLCREYGYYDDDDLEDMIKINNYRLFETTQNFEKEYQMAADVNGDGEKDLQDIIKINNYIKK